MTRERWLLDAVGLMRPEFGRVGSPLEIEVHVSVGRPVRGGLRAGGRSITLGECWSPDVSEDGGAQIYITPLLGDPLRVLATLRHELVHAAVGNDAGHGPRFVKVARKLGLEGKPTATFAGDALLPWLAEITDKLGAYPHPALSPMPRLKQSTRLLKALCPGCGYNFRVTRKWAEVGMPTCPCGAGFVLDDEGDE